MHVKINKDYDQDLVEEIGEENQKIIMLQIKILNVIYQMNYLFLFKKLIICKMKLKI